MDKQNKKMDDFEVMSKMSKDNLDIAMFPNVIAADKVKQGFKITIGVPESAGQKIINQMATDVQTHFVVMYMINIEQFNRIKNGQTEG